MKKTLALIFAIFMIVSCFTACGETQGDNRATTSQGIEDIKIPEENLEDISYGNFKNFKAVDLSGKTVSDKIFKGKKLTMVNIWATFCRPCINEMPDLETLNKEYADKDFQIIGIVCDVSYSGEGYNKELFNSALDVVDATGVTYTNLLPSGSLDIIKLGEVYSVPETIFVDENGQVIGNSYIGSRSYEDWKAIVDDILETM
jgi:thiol-disulfide isomerase/thioredoxin